MEKHLEYLCSLPEKELDNILSKKYKTYYYSNLTNIICKIVYQKYNIVIMDYGNTKSVFKNWSEEKENFDILTKEHINRIKKETLCNLRLKQSTQQKINFINKVIRSVMDEDTYDVYRDSDYIYIILHFPEITMTNSVEQSHIIRDVYIKMYIRTNSLTLRDIAIARSTVTENEYIKKYTFSHCSRGFSYQWNNNICFGDTTIHELKNDLNIKNSVIDLPYFITLLKSYLSWESIEGTPFIRMDSIVDNTQIKAAPQNWTNSDIINAVNLVLCNTESFEYNFNETNGIACPFIDTKSIEKIENILTECSDFKRFVYPSVNRKSIIVTPLKITDNIPQYTDIYFKGCQVPFKIVKDEVADTKNVKMSIHNLFLSQVIEEIEIKFTKFLTDKYEVIYD